VTPVYFKLQRYNSAPVTGTAEPAQVQPQNQPANQQGDQNTDPGQAAPPPSASQPVANDTAAQQQTPAPPQP